MTGDEVRRLLSEIEPDDTRQLTALARRIVHDASQSAASLTHVWASASTSDRQKAQTVLETLRELAVDPWLSVGAAGHGSRDVEAALQACRAYLAAQEDLLQRLGAMMDVTTRVPPREMEGPVEEEEQPSRECDEAYLLVRRLLRVDESVLIRTLNRELFLSLPPSKRDAEISNFKKTGHWAVFVEEDEES